MITVELNFQGKLGIDELIENIRDIGPISENQELDNTLHSGDNLEVMKSMLKHHNMEGMIDFIYIDPPYASNQVFSVSDGRKNTISRVKDGDVAYSDVLKEDDYLAFIYNRLILMKQLLSENGSIFVHLDDTMGHYVKILMDEVFGMKNFRNDISRIKCNPKNSNSKQFGNQKDNIYFYTKSKKNIWNDPRTPKTDAQIEKAYTKTDSGGNRYTTVPLHAPGETKDGPTGKPWRGMEPPEGRHWRTKPEEFDKLDEEGRIEWSRNGNPRIKNYAKDDKGNRMQDIIEYKDPQNPSYPTEKPWKMIEMLIRATTNNDGLVFDCFCGSGSTLFAAKKSGRRYIGIDQSDMAIKISTKRLNEISD